MTNSILRDGGKEIRNNDESTITIDFANVQGGWPGTGNIGAASNIAVPAGITTDLDGDGVASRRSGRGREGEGRARQAQ